jgi:hypothetical protein
MGGYIVCKRLPVRLELVESGYQVMPQFASEATLTTLS